MDSDRATRSHRHIGRGSRRTNGGGGFRRRGLALIVLLVLQLPIPGVATGNPAPSSPPASEAVLTAAAVWSVDRARPGDRVGLAVVVTVARGFHINADAGQLSADSGFTPYPTRVQITQAPAGIVVGRPIFPEAHSIDAAFAPEPVRVFDGQFPIFMPVTLPSNLTGTNLALEISMDFQACDAATCLLPQHLKLNTRLPVAADGQRPKAMAPDLFAAMPEMAAAPSDEGGGAAFGRRLGDWPTAAGAGLILLLAAAAGGGLLLNFTPCVLPLIPIKIMSLANAAHNRSRCFALGLTTFLGVVAFWLLLGLVIALSSSFTATAQLFQWPAFTIVVGLIIAALAVGMWGAFSIPVPRFFYRFNPDGGTLPGAFGVGLLSAVLSTPCTAPVMGAATAWAATLPPPMTGAVFTAIGLGMGLPYLVLSAAPGLVQRMPRSGPTGEMIKQTMALFLMAAAAYFVGAGLSAAAVSPPDPPTRIYWWPVMGFIAAGGLWAACHLAMRTSRRWVQSVCGLVALVVLCGSLYGGYRLTARGPVDWIYFTEERYQQARSEKRVVVLVFTAAWCLNCKALEHGVLNSRRAVELLASDDVAPIKVDLTARNPAGRERLRQTGYLTIPLLVVLAPDGRETLKRSFYTVRELVAAVESARASAN